MLTSHLLPTQLWTQQIIEFRDHNVTEVMPHEVSYMMWSESGINVLTGSGLSMRPGSACDWCQYVANFMTYKYEQGSVFGLGQGSSHNVGWCLAWTRLKLSTCWVKGSACNQSHRAVCDQDKDSMLNKDKGSVCEQRRPQYLTAVRVQVVIGMIGHNMTKIYVQ